MTVRKRYYIGVDGGGTKTALGAYDATGQCVAEAVCPPLNYHFIGVDAALSNRRQGIEALHIPIEQIDAVGIGDPALDDVTEGEAAEHFSTAVRDRLPAEHCAARRRLSVAAATFFSSCQRYRR